MSRLGKVALGSRFRLRELRLGNYRAFKNARLDLEDVTFLVGRNGAGKSTLLDALAFLQECVTDSLEVALDRRDGIASVQRRVPARGAPADVSVSVVFESDRRTRCLYGLQLGSRRSAPRFYIKEERLEWYVPGPTLKSFHRRGLEFESNVADIKPPLGDQTLALPLVAGGVDSWQVVLAALRALSVHRFSPGALKGEPRVGSSRRLDGDGGNLGDILKTIQDQQPASWAWVMRHMAKVVPGLDNITTPSRGGRRQIRFVLRTAEGDDSGCPFTSPEMSDGAVRLLGVLAALKQRDTPSLVAIDEIEDSLHPAALGVALEAVEACSSEMPVLLTTHSPEVLSHRTAAGPRIRVVQWTGGSSGVYHLADRTLGLLHPPETVGRLLRANALWPSEAMEQFTSALELAG